MTERTPRQASSRSDVESLLDSITPWPWECREQPYAYSGSVYWTVNERGDHHQVVVRISPMARTSLRRCAANATFIAAAPTIIRALLDRVDELEARLVARPQLQRDADTP